MPFYAVSTLLVPWRFYTKCHTTDTLFILSLFSSNLAIRMFFTILALTLKNLIHSLCAFSSLLLTILISITSLIAPWRLKSTVLLLFLQVQWVRELPVEEYAKEVIEGVSLDFEMHLV
jgi:hypothetical protein